MKKPFAKKLSAMLCAVILLCGLFSACFCALAEDRKTVRVGYMDYHGFINLMTDGTYSGYGAEYLSKVAEYTGWHYEYVYGNWSDLLEMLKNKEIDLLCNAQYTKRRSEIFDFSRYPIGYTQGLLYTRSDNKWLDLAVVAEGVETGEQIATLRSMDCNYVQGFYYAKPMQQEAFENLLATSKTTEMICTSQTARQYVQKAKPQKSAPSEREMLIVDDIEFNRAVLAGAFDGEYTIVEKENGSEAWDYLCENYASVDIVLLDLLMPVMDGFQLLDRIRADEKMKSLPVIITSQGSAQNEKRALQMQADDFLSKPYNPDVIRRRVHNVIASHRIVEYEHRRASEAPEGIANAQDVFAVVNSLKPHFDIVRLVEPESTLVCSQSAPAGCEIHACYAVWGKATRCNNCISLKALTTKGRHCKLEYSANGLYFVVAEYIPFGSAGAVIEMVTKLDDEYVDNVFDKKLLYANLDAIHQQMEFDELTGIYNRRFIKRRLPELVSDAKAMKRNVSVAMADIDMFKKLNDSYGHLAGDKILRMVADVLRSNLCVNPDDFVARFGGDEFLIVCTDVNRNEMMKRLIGVMKILPHMALNDDAISVEIGISSGCVDSAEFPQFDAAQLVDIADKRLYKAKESGRGNVRTED